LAKLLQYNENNLYLLFCGHEYSKNDCSSGKGKLPNSYRKGVVMDEILNQFQQRYQQLRAMRDAGQLNPQQFIAEVQKLRWQDSRQVWWGINTDGACLYYDGRQWMPAQSPQVARRLPTHAPEALPLPVQAPAQAPTARSGFSSLVEASPILAIVPSLLCGSVWFLYTFLGVFKGENIAGIDCITPLIVGGLPVLFWALKKPIDKLLMPFKPAIQSIPRPMRLGIALAVPILLGCGCSLLSTTGYSGLHVSSFVSVMTAAVLLRY